MSETTTTPDEDAPATPAEEPPAEPPAPEPEPEPEPDAPAVLDAAALTAQVVRLSRRVAALEEVFTAVVAGEPSGDPLTEGFLRHKERARKLSGG